MSEEAKKLSSTAVSKKQFTEALSTITRSLEAQKKMRADLTDAMNLQNLELSAYAEAVTRNYGAQAAVDVLIAELRADYEAHAKNPEGIDDAVLDKKIKAIQALVGEIAAEKQQFEGKHQQYVGVLIDNTLATLRSYLGQWAELPEYEKVSKAVLALIAELDQLKSSDLNAADKEKALAILTAKAGKQQQEQVAEHEARVSRERDVKRLMLGTSMLLQATGSLLHAYVNYSQATRQLEFAQRPLTLLPEAFLDDLARDRVPVSAPAIALLHDRALVDERMAFQEYVRAASDMPESVDVEAIYGLKRHVVLRQTDSLYQSIILQLQLHHHERADEFRGQITHYLRLKAASCIRTNASCFEDEYRDAFARVGGIEVYLEAMQKETHPGDDITLLALAILFQRQIILLSVDDQDKVVMTVFAQGHYEDQHPFILFETPSGYYETFSSKPNQHFFDQLAGVDAGSAAGIER